MEQQAFLVESQHSFLLASQQSFLVEAQETRERAETATRRVKSRFIVGAKFELS